jgi:putative transposase
VCPRISGSSNRADVTTGQRPFIRHPPDGRMGQHGILRDNTPVQEVVDGAAAATRLRSSRRSRRGARRGACCITPIAAISMPARPIARRSGATAWMEASMSRRGNCWDNAVVESFFASPKTERTHEQRYATVEEAEADVRDYIERFYNRQRRHSTRGHLSPALYELRPVA